MFAKGLAPIKDNDSGLNDPVKAQTIATYSIGPAESVFLTNDSVYAFCGCAQIRIWKRSQPQQQMQLYLPETVDGWRRTLWRENATIIMAERIFVDSSLNRSNAAYIMDVLSESRDPCVFSVPNNSVHMDFDGEDILLVEYNNGDAKQASLHRLTLRRNNACLENEPQNYKILKIPQNSMPLCCFARLWGSEIVVVQGERHILILDSHTRGYSHQISYTHNAHSSPIVAVAANDPSHLVTVDSQGVLRVWVRPLVLINEFTQCEADILKKRNTNQLSSNSNNGDEDEFPVRRIRPTNQSASLKESDDISHEQHAKLLLTDSTLMSNLPRLVLATQIKLPKSATFNLTWPYVALCKGNLLAVSCENGVYLVDISLPSNMKSYQKAPRQRDRAPPYPGRVWHEEVVEPSPINNNQYDQNYPRQQQNNNYSNNISNNYQQSGEGLYPYANNYSNQNSNNYGSSAPHQKQNHNSFPQPPPMSFGDNNEMSDDMNDDEQIGTSNSETNIEVNVAPNQSVTHVHQNNSFAVHHSLYNNSSQHNRNSSQSDTFQAVNRDPREEEERDVSSFEFSHLPPPPQLPLRVSSSQQQQQQPSADPENWGHAFKPPERKK